MPLYVTLLLNLTQMLRECYGKQKEGYFPLACLIVIRFLPLKATTKASL